MYVYVFYRMSHNLKSVFLQEKKLYETCAKDNGFWDNLTLNNLTFTTNDFLHFSINFLLENIAIGANKKYFTTNT